MSDDHPTLPHIELSVGEVLRRARLQYGLDHARVSHDLRIRAVYLDALERNAYDELPGKAYVSGFVRAYADYLGLDGEKMVGLLKQQAAVVVTRPVYVFPEAKDDFKIPQKRVIIAASCLAFILLVWLYHAQTHNTVDDVPPVPKELTAQLTAPAKPAPAPEAATLTAPEPPPAHPIILRAVEDTWLEIRGNDNVSLFSRVLAQGEEYWVPIDQTQATMTTGNAGGLEIILDGVTLAPLGKAGEVKRRVLLDKDALKGLKKTEKPAM
jgi:cytoskeleton protein RodZ